MEAEPLREERKALYESAEARVNLFNIKCLAVLLLLMLATESLTELGIFTAEKAAVRLCAAAGTILFGLPILVYLIHDQSPRREDTILKKSWFKYLAISSAFLGIGILCTALTFQSVILLALPPILAAQYRNQKRLLLWTLIGTALLVVVSVYGGFFFGLADWNMLKAAENPNLLTRVERVALATPQRMKELFWHYAMPRLICVTAVAVLASGITRRNAKMLEDQAALAEKVQEEMERKNSLQTRVIDALATLIETRDVSTGEHVIRTKKYVGMIAREMQKSDQYKDYLTDHVIQEIENAAALHDVGKIAVSDVILLKPGRLTPEEFEEIKKHSTKGGEVIRNIFSTFEDDAAFLKIAEDIAVSHHEKWNGTGYPAGLKGEDIPLPARIMAVADVFDALVSVRVYKPAMTPDAALDLIISESGSHFDPDIIRVVSGMRRALIDAVNTPV
ncbi:MAG: HD domain-containing protein [Clostridia bacterium]|nr:HD domain-containing protein [Clostridia bacterium]